MAGRGDLLPSGFGKELQRMRKEKGLTQKELADAAELHPNTVARLERGEHEPTWPLVLKFASVLGVDCTAFSGIGSAVKEPAPKKPAAKSAAKHPKKK